MFYPFTNHKKIAVDVGGSGSGDQDVYTFTTDAVVFFDISSINVPGKVELFIKETDVGIIVRGATSKTEASVVYVQSGQTLRFEKDQTADRIIGNLSLLELPE